MQALTSNNRVMTPSDVAEWTQTERHNITALVDRMRRDGLVITERNSSDKRRVNITLTDKGREVLKQAMPVAKEVVSQAMSSITEGDAALTDVQKETVARSFSYICSKFDSILEETQSHQHYITMKVLIPMDVAVADIVEGGINECNTFGDFLDENYYVTNVKIPTEAENQHYIRETGRGVE
ncbi:MarR family winged helix-turn-helix transcriptional regulator [Chloroflexota bacterium]